VWRRPGGRWGSEVEGRQLSRIGAEVVRRRDGGDEIDTHYKVFTLIQPLVFATPLI